MKLLTRLSPCLLGIILCSPPASGYDLLDAWQAARQYDSGYAAAGGEYRAGQTQAAQGLAPLLPQVSVNGKYNETHPIGSAAGIDTSGVSHGYEVNLTQQLFDTARLAGYRKGQIQQALAGTTYDSAAQQLMLAVASAYFNVLLAQDTLAATAIAKKAYANQLAQAKTEFEIGSATIADANEAQAGYDGAVADEIQAENDLELSRNALARLTGLPPLGLQPLQSQFALERPSPDSLNDWIALALANSLKIQAKQQALALAEQTLAEKRAGHMPVVQLSAGYQDSVSNNPAASLQGANRTRGNTVGITLSLPLYSGGGIDAQVSEAIALRDSARDQVEDSRRQVREDVRTAWLGVTNGAASVRAQQQRLVSAQNKLDSTQLGREVGIRTNLDLLKAQQEFSNVLKDLANARYRFLNAQLQLAQAAGRLDLDTLARVNRAIRH